MNDEDTASAFLDGLAEEARANQPQPGEYTLEMLCEEMAKRGLAITREVARRMVKGWSVRVGRAPNGVPARFYRPPG
jgi:hypothetical protein